MEEPKEESPGTNHKTRAAGEHMKVNDRTKA